MSNELPAGLTGQQYLNLADEHQGEAHRSYKTTCACYARAYETMGADAFWAECELRGKKRFMVSAFLRSAGWIDPNPRPPRSPLAPMKAAVRKYFFPLSDGEKEEIVAMMLGETK